VNRGRLFSAKEDKVGFISRKGHGICVLGCWRHFVYSLSWNGKTITRECYSNLLTRLDEKICEKRPGLQKKKKYLSSGQCTRLQKCFGNGKIKGSALWVVGTSTLFPRFGSLWLLPLPKTKLFLSGQRFTSNQEANAAVVGYFAGLMKNHYRDGIMALEHRWNKCISLKGDYVEK
jgi:hypothetical protein